MDLNDIRAAVTLLSLLAFLAIVWRVYARRAADYQACAVLPLDGDPPVEPSATQTPQENPQ